MATPPNNVIVVPPPNPLVNTHNLLSATVRLLAIGGGTIRERLFHAYIHEFQLIGLTHDGLREIDPIALKLFQEVNEQMTSHPEEISGEGTVTATIRHMSDDEAVDIAKKICELELRIGHALGD